jgi:hypothetical protein
MPCGVYLIADDQTGQHKIGFSVDPEARMATLQREVGRPLRLVHVIEAPEAALRNAERDLHGLMARRRYRLEWFILSEADVQWFTGLKRWYSGGITKPPPPEQHRVYWVTCQGGSICTRNVAEAMSALGNRLAHVATSDEDHTVRVRWMTMAEYRQHDGVLEPFRQLLQSECHHCGEKSEHVTSHAAAFGNFVEPIR